MLNYKISGKGDRQLLFIHGNSQCLECWDDVTTLSHLKDKYTLIAIDLPGHGKSFRSDHPEKDYSIEGLSDHVRECIKKFEHQPYLLIGNSLGANIVGEIVPTLINCKGILLNGATAIDKNTNLSDVAHSNPLIPLFYTDEVKENELELLINELAEGLTAEQKQNLKIMFANTDGKFRAQLGIDIANGNFSNELVNLENSGIPVAIVYGENDKFCKTDFFEKRPLKKWKDKIFLIPNSGHCSQVDQPYALSKIIEDFSGTCF